MEYSIISGKITYRSFQMYRASVVNYKNTKTKNN